MNPVRVVVVEDQATVREGLVALLGMLPGIEVVAEAADGRSAVDAVARHAPDVVLMDVRMPGTDGVAATAEVARTYPSTAVVVLTSHADDETVFAALAAGARGFLTKSAGRREISQAIFAAAAGLSPMDPTVQSRIVSTARLGHVPPSPPDGLTPREAQVLALIAAGLTNAQIALRMRISPATVKSHINRAFAKVNVTDRAAAADYARCHNLATF
ncbi:response regulator transcription factor [Microbispora sp. RL4-1S]|uniref:Response regulator transcription factor n=1 Tax=Microbispora oryzae TaxID=2806554 RepID=A0A941AKB1_9ACTN|nr:response regulator transcription factor [Microbispora oryzae]MBP2705043.1 response regulator transcription factor [Microbispora oryzae]